MLGLVGASLVPLFAVANTKTQSHIACTSVADQPGESSAQAWLAHSRLAGHCYAFQARAVTIDALGVRTLALSHRIRDGVRQQVVQHLDGPSVSIERRSIVGYIPRFTSDADSGLASPDAWAQHIASYYDISFQEDARVAGRDAVQLRFVPHDQQRYQHAWWVDKETGLLLKHVMSDTQERVLETFQITQLHSPELYDGSVNDAISTERGSYPWQVAWLPDGFVDQPQEPGRSASNQRVYSDGLAAFSLFVNAVEDPTLREGVHRLGVSTAAVSIVSAGERRWQVVGIGELPPDMLQRIVQSVHIEP
ncbi:MucB/RseB C-terminal domain-containing protein [Vreelandella lutescens]|uniref:Sigma factor AlgU regulatory protein MucB n=1 Tax=Vreelandella lutescens TaxID=1602943 RepID=A0ABQ1NRY5_9GAMM|nr:MucB/RseB C-terminal domain-containing protein [Halomonas lutescens]GGC82384.1 sigma factor AlgU regulatory protein MucB [Halomonas lutescens]